MIVHHFNGNKPVQIKRKQAFYSDLSMSDLANYIYQKYYSSSAITASSS